MVAGLLVGRVMRFGVAVMWLVWLVGRLSGGWIGRMRRWCLVGRGVVGVGVRWCVSR